MVKGFTIKVSPDPNTPVQIKVHNSLSFDESLGLTMTALRSFLNATKKQMLSQPDENITPEEQDKTVRAVLYDKAVIAFSYMLDEFFPEGKELKEKQDGFEKYLQEHFPIKEAEKTEENKEVK